MKSRRLSIIFALMVLFNAIFAGFAFAEETVPPKDEKLKVVALGDSITFGYPPPSTTAFPDYIANVCKVDKFGGVGATTADLGTAIVGDIINFSNKAKQADVVTINIGSNDFLGATGVGALLKKLQPIAKDPATLQAAIANGELAKIFAENPLTPLTEEQLNTYKMTLATIVTTTDTQADAPIILYNLYNPIVVDPALDAALGGKLTELHSFVESQLPRVNNVINEVGSISGAEVVNAYATINANPTAFILPLDIHPTVAGHKALAKLADNVIAKFPAEELDEDKNPCGNCHNDPVEEPEGCAQTPPDEEEPPVEEPGENPGEQPGENPPTDGPKENPTPQPPVAEQPKAETVKPTPVKAQAKVITSGSELPDTATPIYNYLVIGLALAFVGMISFGIQQYHQKRNEGI